MTGFFRARACLSLSPPVLDLSSLQRRVRLRGRRTVRVHPTRSSCPRKPGALPGTRSRGTPTLAVCRCHFREKINMGSPSLWPRPWTRETSPSVCARKVTGLTCGTREPLPGEGETFCRVRSAAWAVEFCPSLRPVPRRLLRGRRALPGARRGHSLCGKELLTTLHRVGARWLFAVVLRPRKY